MATSIQKLVNAVRGQLTEPQPGYWSDDEIVEHLERGARDLWRAINDNFQHYFLTVDITHVTQPADGTTLSGVPVDVSIVRGIEPLDLNARPGLNYVSRDYNHVDFQRARALGTQDPSQGTRIFYCITGAGAPVAAPTIQVAPTINTAVALRFSYVPTLQPFSLKAATGKLTNNPIPGESDNALIAWAIAYAEAKEAEDNQPDAGWLTIYSTEKQNILTSLTPRQTEDEDVVDAFFEDLWQ